MDEASKGFQQPLDELRQEILEVRKFTLAEAIGRLAGPGAMKGVSPATGKQQAEAQIEIFLERHLSCPAGALTSVLLRQVKESDILLNNIDQPFVALTKFVQRVLDSDHLLQELVRQADCEWGLSYGERPYFEKSGAQPHEDDPYTLASVRNTLFQLVEKLNSHPGT
jgi:hypothetical protein